MLGLHSSSACNDLESMFTEIEAPFAVGLSIIDTSFSSSISTASAVSSGTRQAEAWNIISEHVARR